jgi:hypothetical protein
MKGLRSWAGFLITTPNVLVDRRMSQSSGNNSMITK